MLLQPTEAVPPPAGVGVSKSLETNVLSRDRRQSIEMVWVPSKFFKISAAFRTSVSVALFLF